MEKQNKEKMKKIVIPPVLFKQLIENQYVYVDGTPANWRRIKTNMKIEVWEEDWCKKWTKKQVKYIGGPEWIYDRIENRIKILNLTGSRCKCQVKYFGGIREGHMNGRNCFLEKALIVPVNL